MARVCIDPGHGGDDPGAVGPTGLKEKDVVLDIALQTGKLLASAGVEVSFTRTNDQVLWPADERMDLVNRCRIANQTGADFFVSIHCNSANNPDAHGTETYYCSRSDRGAIVARLIQEELVKTLGLRDRQTKEGNYYVLRETVMPAVLTEIAFINNQQEEQLLARPDFRVKVAQAISGVLVKYFGAGSRGGEPEHSEPQLVINGRVVTNVPSCLIDGKTYVELRSLVSNLGGEVRWDEMTKTIIVEL
jgi:N-acetylmuramoyl-L-alanine amidase